MAKKVRSLSDQMAELSNVAPRDADMDPESDVDAYDAMHKVGGDESDDDLEEEARSHARHNYAEVAPSKMRKQANFIEGVDSDQMKRYAGVKTTRREMMDEEDSNDDDDDVAEEEDDDELEQNEKNSSSSAEDSDEVQAVEDGESIDDEDIDDGGEESASAPIKRTTQVRFQSPTQNVGTNGYLNAAQSDAQLLQDLRRRNREDAERGRDARKQMDAWGKLLGLRIRGQKVVRGSGRISSKMIKSQLGKFSEADRDAYKSTLSSLDEMSSHLFTLQRQILQSFTSTDTMESNVVSSGLSRLDSQLDEICKPHKRSYDEIDDTVHDLHLDTIVKLDQAVFEPLWRDVLARWSSRTSVSNLDGSHKNKFESSLKAMNQSAEDQIDRGLTGDAFERLRKRTRVWRGSEKESRIVVGATSRQGDDDDDDSDEEHSSKGEDEADIFDDSDFYSAMLRELIDSRGAASSVMSIEGSESSLAWAQAAKRASKTNNNGDMKASKGRKLRFDVIEKLENFMPPIPRETWSKEQIDRLVHQLKGGDRAADKVDVEVIDPVAAADKEDRVELAGLRLFG